MNQPENQNDGEKDILLFDFLTKCRFFSIKKVTDYPASG